MIESVRNFVNSGTSFQASLEGFGAPRAGPGPEVPICPCPAQGPPFGPGLLQGLLRGCSEAVLQSMPGNWARSLKSVLD